MIHLGKWESNSGWGFAFAVKRYAATRNYVRSSEVARVFEVSRCQAELALTLMCEIGYMGKRSSDGRYYTLTKEQSDILQTLLSEARSAAIRKGVPR
jgi:CTP-dependent riboflavin kinase